MLVQRVCNQLEVRICDFNEEGPPLSPTEKDGTVHLKLPTAPLQRTDSWECPYLDNIQIFPVY